MALVAYPHGLADIQKTNEWRDTVAAAFLEGGEAQVTEEMINDPPERVRAAAVPEVLRMLHARHAMELPFTAWQAPRGGSAEYLIQDSDLRSFYGGLIGKIAFSHHLSISQLEMHLGRVVSAFTRCPAEWQVDPIKLACLLRCADVAHIDNRRAPRFLHTLRRPQGLSENHWSFQEKIGKPQCDGDALVYTSGPDFALPDADAWWLCYDTVRMIRSRITRHPCVTRGDGTETTVCRSAC